MVRAIAAERDREHPQVPVRCWVSSGWPNGLRVDRHPDWSDGGRAPKGRAGVAQVVIARPSRRGRLAVCGYLVDTWCLGVKNAIGPRRMSEREPAAFGDVFFKPWHSTGVIRRPPHVLRTLELSAGPGNFNFAVTADIGDEFADVA